MSAAFMAQLPFIGASTTLGWHRDEVAQSYMEHILQRARVLLPRRGWHVGLVKEFYPRGASLLGLNVNAGSEVCIRFRVPGKKNEFLPFHEVLCTALHEFTHCVHSRHDRAFWNLYYDLVKECEALEVSMIQQGRQLYPEMSYTLMSASPATAAPSFGGRGRQLGTSSRAGGAGRGRGRGGATGGGSSTGTRSRSGTRTVTSTAGATVSRGRGTPAPPASIAAAFPGAGRRLGGDGLKRFDSPTAFTPTRDALRRILAGAAERRQRLASLAALQPPSRSPSVLASGGGAASGVPAGGISAEEPLSDSVEEALPDEVPLSLHDEHDSTAGWTCSRCGFRNEAGVASGSCAFCADDDNAAGGSSDGECSDGDGDGEAPVAVKRPRGEAEGTPARPATHASPVDLPHVLMASGTAPLRHDGATKEGTVVLSDDDEG